MKNLNLVLKVVCLCLMLTLASIVNANNIQMLSKPVLTQKDVGEGTVKIRFSFQWDNSWKLNKPNNWDAAWVFVKYREGANDWQHVYIDSSNSVHDFVASDDAGVKIPTVLKTGMSNIVNADGSTERKAVGAFLYRKNNGQGSIKFDSVCFKWNYAQQGLDESSIVSLKVFALEMVYIPQGTFYATDGTTGHNRLTVHGDSARFGKENAYAKFPAPGKNLANSIFNSSSLGTGVFFPSGGMNTKVDPKLAFGESGWYMEQSNTITMWRNFDTWSSNLMHSLWGWTAYNLYGNGKTWRTIRIKMPRPYTAYGAWSGIWASSGWRAEGYCVRGSEDGENWTELYGSLTTPEGKKNYQNSPAYDNTNVLHYFPATEVKAYNYYEFNYTRASIGSYISAYHYGLVDTVLGGGDMDNNWYYEDQNNVPYAGLTPIHYGFGSDGNEYADINFPNGYEAFYMMKYELSQHAYVDFLNTLSNVQQKSRSMLQPNQPSHFHYITNTATASPYRNHIKVRTQSPNASAVYGMWTGSDFDEVWDVETNGGNIAMNFVDWPDVAAYLCWAGLRPLTELEFEKACRGPLPPVKNEFAWGTTSYTAITTDPLKMLNYNRSDEVALAGDNYVGINSTNYPVRVGLFATNASTRTSAGAGYYGALNLSDNVSEMYLNISTPEGRKFSGEHGSGKLTGNGDADIVNWPAATRGLSTTGYGLGFRGHSSTPTSTPYAETSERYHSNANISHPQTRYYWMGCRGGRTAPNN